MENHHFLLENPLLMAIFNSYVSLPEGMIFHYYQRNQGEVTTRAPKLAIPRRVEAGVRGRADRWLSTRVGNLCETSLEWQKLDPYLKFKLKGNRKMEGHLRFTDIGYWCVWCFVFFFTYVFLMIFSLHVVFVGPKHCEEGQKSWRIERQSAHPKQCYGMYPEERNIKKFSD